MNTGRWRSKTEYRLAEKLSAGDLAWEYLRRNPRYREVWRELGPDAPEVAVAPWGLRFRG